MRNKNTLRPKDIAKLTTLSTGLVIAALLLTACPNETNGSGTSSNIAPTSSNTMSVVTKKPFEDCFQDAEKVKTVKDVAGSGFEFELGYIQNQPPQLSTKGGQVIAALTSAS